MKFFYIGDLSLLIYLLIHFYLHELMDIYFIFCSIIQYYLTLLLKLFQLWPLEAFLIGFCVCLTYSVIVVWFFFSKISLLSGTTRYCRLNLFISYIIFRISKKAWFLWSEMVLETKILAQGILNKYVFNGGKGIVNVCQRRVSCHKKYQNNWWYLKGIVHWMTRRNCLDLYYCLLILLVQRENLHFILVISNMGIYFPNMVNELEALSFSQTKTLN